MGKDPDILVDLTTAANEFEAGVIVEALRGQGIHAESFTTAGAVLQWEAVVSQPFRVAVRRADVEAARAALRAIKADSVDLDWDEVDTGTAEGEAPEDATRAREWGRTAWWLIAGLVAMVMLAAAGYLVQSGMLG
ncbi:MAG: hypothetical protein WD749_08315 [Phycisphaerales bacterium]